MQSVPGCEAKDFASNPKSSAPFTEREVNILSLDSVVLPQLAALQWHRSIRRHNRRAGILHEQ